MKENEPGRERKPPTDVTLKFLDSSPSEFKAYLDSLGSVHVSLTLDMKDVPPPEALKELITDSKGQISEVRIKADQQDHDTSRELFIIPGVIWEQI